MPHATEILASASTIANEWRWLAIVWHGLLAAAVVGMVRGWRPSKPLAGGLLVLPLATVSALAWSAGNPFNGLMFLLFAAGLAAVAMTLPREPVGLSEGWLSRSGAVLFAFGWIYPHFLLTASWTSYLYAAPVGLVPCPTLAVVGGASLLTRTFDSARWAIAVGAMSLFYGAVGTFRLGVVIDIVLLAGGAALVCLGTLSAFRSRGHAFEDRDVSATEEL